MLGSMFSGISGLMSNSQSINVVGNNIANVNTIGFKGSRATFSDLLYQSINGTAGASQVGRGSTLTTVDTQFAQGSFESTSEPTDLAIGGKGFFVVKAPEGNMTEYYTRAGQFRFDKDGNLANPTGLILQGKTIDQTTQKAVGVDTNVIISQKPSDPKITTAVDMTVNLQSNAEWKGAVGDLEGTGTSISSVTNTLGKWPISGDYSAVVTADATITRTDVSFTAATSKITTVAGDFSGLVAGDKFTLAGSTSNNGTFTIVSVAADGKSMTVSETVADEAAGDTGTIDRNLLTVTVTRTKPDGTSDTPIIKKQGVTTDQSISDFQGLGIDVNTGSSIAAGTQTLAVSGFDVDNPTTTSNYSSSITVYDSNGQSHVVTTYFRKSHIDASSNSIWEWMAVVGAGDSVTGENTMASSGDLTFNTSGVLQGEASNHQIFFNFTTPAKQNQPINLSFGTLSAISGGTTKDPLTQYPIDSATNYQAQDGFPPGTLTSVSVDADGIISGHYSNGQIIKQYQITLANFGDPVGLTKEGNNLFSANNQTGDAYKYAPGVSGTGKINPNSLEQSNVDLATEFVKMIVAQRGFQANSRVITTSDEILQELMNLKR